MRRAASIVFCLALFGLAPQPASAAADQCGPGDLCVWEHDNYTGSFATLPFQDPDCGDGTPTWSEPCKEPEFWTDGGHCRNKDYD